jgi:uncharacterized protein (TIGR03437 family)
MRALVISCFLLGLSSASAQNLSELDRILDEMRQSIGASATLLVQQNGQTIYSRSTGDWSATRAIPIASASKWLSGAVLMTVVDEGRLSLDHTVDRYLPEFTGPSGKATIRQLFSMTSGFGPTDPPCVNDRSTTLEACAKDLATVSLAIPPGTGFIYGSTGMQLAARIAEVATGRRWSDLQRERLYTPLGMTASRPALLNADSNPLVAGGYVSSAQDYQRFLNMILNGGVHEGRRILSSRAIDVMLADQTSNARIVFSPYQRDPATADTRYGIGNWRQLVTNGVLEESSSTGAFGFTPWVDHTRNLTGVLSVLNDNPVVMPFYLRIREVLLRQIPKACLTRRGVTNAANYSAGRLVPGSIITVFGDNIGPVSQLNIAGISAPVIASFPNQLSALVPFEIAGRNAAELRLNNLPPLQMPVDPTDPGIFTLAQTGNGPAAALITGDIATIYLTGTGQTTAAGQTGAVATNDLKRVSAPIEITIANQPATILYAGTSPGSFEGLTQINLRLPANLPRALHPIRLTIGGITASGNPQLDLR